MQKLLLLMILALAACHTTGCSTAQNGPGPTERPPDDKPLPPRENRENPTADNTWRYAQPPATAALEQPPGQPVDEGQRPQPRRDAEPKAEKMPAPSAPMASSPPSSPEPSRGAGKKSGADYDMAPQAEMGGSESRMRDSSGSAPDGVLKNKSMPAPMPVQPERPGLATSWGETRYSAVSEVPFTRASDSPTFSASLWYNDRMGADAMARYATGYAQTDRVQMYLARGLSVSLRDEYGSALQGYRANGKVYAIGENGRRYTIVIENHTGTRFEILASVDGLDVLDGRSAGYNKRGYLIEGNGRLEIEGFRQSEDAVAAFRFGSVRNSYAKQTTGSDRNVGVIGVAAFAERAAVPYWSSRDAERRQQADPFPSKWAQEPQRPPQEMYQVR